ncbi:MAG: helicase-related protein [Candidatus Woesearchaeota archaeon]
MKLLEQEKITGHTPESPINLIIDCINDNKQIIIFNASKSTAQSTAKKVAQHFKKQKINISPELEEASQKILVALSSPTSQCRELSDCIKYGIAFHHAGLIAKQRSIIEDLFKQKILHAISSTPTLAAGLNLPASVTFIKDYKRFSQRGYQDIPVLEYQQMAGRAGRPGVETIGVSVIHIKDSDDEEKRVSTKFIHGESEEIFSKLAVEPTLKMYLLSLIAMDSINSKEEIEDFFLHSLYGHQFEDKKQLFNQIFRILHVLERYGFIRVNDNYYIATPMGKKISELYLNPDTAHYYLTLLPKIVELFKQFSFKEANVDMNKNSELALLHSICNVIEMKPYFYIKKKEEDEIYMLAQDLESELLTEYDPFEQEIGEFLSILKTAQIYQKWINEFPESLLHDQYNITPGELNYKLNILDWLLYCIEELLGLKKELYSKSQIKKLRVRVKYGVRLELLPLLTLKSIGRKRARDLYERGIKSPNNIKELPKETIIQVMGEKRANTLLNSLNSQSQKEIATSLKIGKPQEIRAREVSSEEVEILLKNQIEYEEEKKKELNNLLDFF